MKPAYLRPQISSTLMIFLSDLVDVRERYVPNLDILVAPFVEELRCADLLRHVLGQDWVALGRLDLNFAVRHIRGTVSKGGVLWWIAVMRLKFESPDVADSVDGGVRRTIFASEILEWAWRSA